MFIPLNGPAVNNNATVGSTAVEAKVGATILEDRKIVTIQPLSDHLYFGYSSGVTSLNGTKIFKGQVYTLEATDQLPIWIISASEDNDVRITEVG